MKEQTIRSRGHYLACLLLPEIPADRQTLANQIDDAIAIFGAGDRLKRTSAVRGDGCADLTVGEGDTSRTVSVAIVTEYYWTGTGEERFWDAVYRQTDGTLSSIYTLVAANH